MRLLIALAALALAAPPSPGQQPRPGYERQLEALYRRPLAPSERELIRAPMSDAERYRLFERMWKWGEADRRPRFDEVDPGDTYRFFHETVPPWGWLAALGVMVVLSRPRRRKEPR